MSIYRIIAIWTILIPSISFSKVSSSPNLCGALFDTNFFTTSVEWETTTIPKKNNDEDPLFTAFKALMGGGSSVSTILYTENFRKLFALYGKNDKGEWVKNLIPSSIWYDFSNDANLITRINNEFYFVDWLNLSEDDFEKVISIIMKSRGQYGDSIKIRKVPEAWSELRDFSPLDKLIPDEVSEEWKYGHFLTLEFPIQGHVHSLQEIENYIRHLWNRIGVLPANKEDQDYALEHTPGHVHWVPRMSKVPPSDAEKFYQAMIGYWGDTNDYLTALYVTLNSSPSEMDMHQAIHVLRWLHGHENSRYSLIPLMKSVYSIPEAEAAGIRPHPSVAVDPLVDPGFPPQMKRTFVGLRGIYSPNRTAPTNGEPVKTPGLEARLLRSFKENWQVLPTQFNSSNDETYKNFLKHANGYNEQHGLIDNADELKERAQQIGIDPDLIETVNQLSYIREVYINEKYPLQYRAALNLLPLNDWLHHPSVRRNLEAMNRTQRNQAIAKLNTAMNRWRTQMNSFMKARKDVSYIHIPDWNLNEKEKLFFSTNRFKIQNHEDYGLAWNLGINLDPHKISQILIAAELARFVQDSNLAKLLKPAEVTLP